MQQPIEANVPLGATGIRVPPIGLGLFKIGRNTKTKYPGEYSLPDNAAVERLLAAAGELGVTMLDTAPAYGSSEQRLGDAMRTLGWPGGRDRWVISTKVGEQFDGLTSCYNYSAGSIRLSVEQSLQRIGVEQLDIVLIHSDGRDREILTDTPALLTLREIAERGNIRAVGISVKTLEGARLAIEQGVDVLMIELNPSSSELLPVVSEAAKLGVGLMIKKPLVSGHMATCRASIDQCFQYLRDAGVFMGGTAIVGTADVAHLREDVKIFQQFISRKK